MRRLLLLALVGVAVVFVVSGAARPAGSVQAEWLVTDLGTLPGRPFTAAVATNDKGQVVGSAERSGGDSRAFLWQNGKMLDLGTLGGSRSRAVAINDRGQVVGDSETTATHKPFGTVVRKSHAFLWQNGKMRDLGTLGGPNSEALAINARGQVVGVSDIKVNRQPNVSVQHAFLWQGGKMRDLGNLGSDVAIDGRGQVIGSGGKGAVLWQNGKTRDLGTLGGRGTWPPADINERGEVVGRSDLKSGSSHAFVWANGKMRDLGVLPGDRYSDAVAINDQSEIIGDSVGKMDWEGHSGDIVAFVYARGKMTALGTLGGQESHAFAISASGQVVGSSVTRHSEESHAFVWANGHMTDLGPQTAATAINNHNQIIGGSGGHAVLWTLRSG